MKKLFFKREAWSEEHTTLVTNFFGVRLISGNEARAFLASHQLPGRTAKNVQDKMKSIVVQCLFYNINQ